MFVRILLWSLIIFFLVRFLWRIISSVFRRVSGEQDHAGSPHGDRVNPPAPYDDVRDAKFRDVPGKVRDQNEGGESASERNP